ncbi:MAG: hypothetical protein AAF437_03850 [Pseudomonadota bacterium]
MTPRIRLLRLAVYSLSLALITCSIIGGLHGYSPVPFWDMWGGTLNFVLQFDKDPVRHLFAQHNEHRIVFSRLLFLADYQWFGGSHVSLIICNYVFATMIWAVFAHCLFRLNSVDTRKADLWLLSAILGAWLMLWAQEMNFTWAFQSQFFLAQLLPLLAFLSLGQASFHPKSWNPWFIAALVLGGLSPLSMANGLLVLLFLTIAAGVLRMKKRQIAVLGLCTAIAMSLYLADYQHPPAHGSVLASVAQHPLATLQFTFRYLGNPGPYLAGPFGITKLFSMLVGVTLSMVTACLVIRALWVRPLHPVSIGLILFIVFVGAGAFLTAGGRLAISPESAFSSRYTTPVLMAWAALFCIASPAMLRYHRTSERAALQMLSAAILGLCLLIPSQVRALIPAHADNHQKAVAALALEMRVADDTMVSRIYPNTQTALAIARMASAEDLGIFGRDEYRGHFERLGHHHATSDAKPCAGRFEQYEIIDSDPDFLRVTGWQFHRDQSRQARHVLILNEEHLIVGVALSGRASPELVDAYGHRAKLSGFTGYVRRPSIKDRLTLISGNCRSEHAF